MQLQYPYSQYGHHQASAAYAQYPNAAGAAAYGIPSMYSKMGHGYQPGKDLYLEVYVCMFLTISI